MPVPGIGKNKIFMPFLYLFILSCALHPFIENAIAQVATGSISGKITDASNGIPLPSTWLMLYDSSWAFKHITNSDSAGNYSFTGIASGNYYLYIAASSGYLTQYFDRSRTSAAATKIAVASGTVTQINIQRERGGTLSGFVSQNADGSPVSGAKITAIDSSYMSFESTSDALGNYSIASLDSGTYSVSVSKSGFVDASKIVEISLGKETTVNFGLTVLGSIAGKVINVDGAGIAAIRVKLQDVDKKTVSDVFANSSGEFLFSNLKAGTYFLYSSNNREYATSYFENAVSLANAKPISVHDGERISNIIIVPPFGGAISGSVTRKGNGGAIANAPIKVYNVSDWTEVTTDSDPGTDSNGYYCIKGLDSGNYYVTATADEFTEYYNGALDIDSATPVPVLQGKTTANINFEVGFYPTISGRVTRPSDGAGIPDINVFAELKDDNNRRRRVF